MFENPTTRRIFLQKGLTMLAVGATVPTFLDETVLAIANPLDMPRTQRASGKDGKILVVVQLSGGNDGLNTVVPFGDDAYHRARPVLGHKAGEVLKLDNYLGLHPNLAPLKEIYDDGRMGIIQGVGYPNPNRSHFRSMDIWHNGDPQNEVVTNGWLGRFFDNTCTGADPHVGVSIGEQMPLAMKGDRIMPLSFDRAENYRYNGKEKDRYLALNKIDPAAVATGADGSNPKGAPSTQPIARPTAKKVEAITPSSQLDFLHRTAMDAQLSSDDILRMTGRHAPPAPYPGGTFGNGLRTIAAMIAGGLPTRVYYVSLGGFDTHANERGRHDNLMQQFAQGVSAFWKDLKRQENDDRVLMMTFSEFGRRVEQNASQGTDHGAAAPMFLFGPKIKPGVIGKHPSLTDLDGGDLKYHTDFRSVYATVLQNWMDAPSKPVLGSQFATMPILKA
ncbi:MAG TPA: DUF1501 domain-containing protein [Tepidisphaeraceae bacterium]|nr:DUF1501 domain-containing protein [Tepidisphaeraceae bacterium]